MPPDGSGRQPGCAFPVSRSCAAIGPATTAVDRSLRRCGIQADTHLSGGQARGEGGAAGGHQVVHPPGDLRATSLVVVGENGPPIAREIARGLAIADRKAVIPARNGSHTHALAGTRPNNRRGGTSVMDPGSDHLVRPVPFIRPDGPSGRSRRLSGDDADICGKRRPVCSRWSVVRSAWCPTGRDQRSVQTSPFRSAHRTLRSTSQVQHRP